MGAVSRTIPITCLFAVSLGALVLAACGREGESHSSWIGAKPPHTDSRKAEADDGMPADWGEGEEDICRHVVPPEKPGDSADTRRAVRQLMGCARAYWNRFEVPTRRAFLFHKLFQPAFGETLPSFYTIRQLRAFLARFRDEVPFHSELSDDERSRFRSTFSRDDLEEFLRLSRYRGEMLSRAEIQILQSVQARRAWLEPFREIDRYAWLLAMKSVLDDPSGNVTARRWRELSSSSGRFPELSEREWGDFASLLHPSALLGLLPGDEKVFLPLPRHPYEAAREERDRHLTGDLRPALVKFDAYAKWRALDNPRLPVPAPFAPDRVRLALLGPGVDFANADLSAIFSPDLSSDFADRDANPWAPGELPGFASGTHQAITVLAAVKGQAPHLLQTRGMELGVWKSASLRELLGDSEYLRSGPLPVWGNRLASHEAIAEKLGAPPEERAAIVATDFDRGMDRVLEELGDPAAFRKSSELWVIQAGRRENRGGREPAHCWQDLPPESRPSSRLLCVGTVKPGPMTPTGARDVIRKEFYAGSDIDLFEYAGYRGSCAGGGTCAGAQVAAAAAILWGAYPRLTAELIRRVLLETAWTQRVAIEGDPGTRTVKVFHASTMMKAALGRAKKYARD